MKCLSVDNIQAWWASHFQFSNILIELADWPSESTTKFVNRTDSVLASHLRFSAESIVMWLIEMDPDFVMVWVNQYGIWPNSEDWNLYQLFREVRADRTHIEDGPGHLFMLHEREDAMSLILLSLAFGWGIIAASSCGRRAMSFDHDSHFAIWSEHAETREQLVKALTIDSPQQL